MNPKATHRHPQMVQSNEAVFSDVSLSVNPKQLLIAHFAALVRCLSNQPNQMKPKFQPYFDYSFINLIVALKFLEESSI